MELKRSSLKASELKMKLIRHILNEIKAAEISFEEAEDIISALSQMTDKIDDSLLLCIRFKDMMNVRLNDFLDNILNSVDSAEKIGREMFKEDGSADSSDNDRQEGTEAKEA